MIRKTLDETPASEAEWILWVDIDTVMPDMAVLPRFDAYEGADLVVWGNRTKIMEGNMNEGAHWWRRRGHVVAADCGIIAFSFSFQALRWASTEAPMGCLDRGGCLLKPRLEPLQHPNETNAD